MTCTFPDATPALAEPPPAAETSAKLCRRDRIEMRESDVHGRSAYTMVAIACGKKIIEYKGEHITWKEALRRHPHDSPDPDYTLYSSLEDGSMIDVKYGGNRVRRINRARRPNCEAREASGRMFTHALRDIGAGEELLYDYGPVIGGRQTEALKERSACRCGAEKCRGTMLTPPEKIKKK